MAAKGKRKVFSTRLDDATVKELKHLSVDTEKSIQTLLREPIEDLLRKYGRRPKPTPIFRGLKRLRGFLFGLFKTD